MVNNNLKKIIAGASVAAIAVGLTATGAFGEFIRFDAPNDEWDYGYGYDDVSGTYGYGYGYGDQTPNNSGTSSSGGGGGWFIFPEHNGTTPSTDDNAIDSQDDVTSGNTDGTTGSLDACEDGEFKDAANSWAKDYINYLGRMGIVNGVSECMYEPNRSITRAEFLKMSLKAFGYTYSSADATNETYSDVYANTWVANAVGKGTEMGIVNGYSDTIFRPNSPISRAEAMKMFLRTAATKYAQFTVDTSVTTSRYTDLAEAWQAKYLEKATDLGVVNGDRDANGNLTNTFRPNDSITRAESAKVVARSIQSVN